MIELYHGLQDGDKVRVRNYRYKGGSKSMVGRVGTVVDRNDLHYTSKMEARVDFGDGAFNPKRGGDVGWIPTFALEKV